MPDFLFFADEQNIDLNKTYGTRNKRYKVRGILNILDSYKFTINYVLYDLAPEEITIVEKATTER